MYTVCTLVRMWIGLDVNVSVVWGGGVPVCAHECVVRTCVH